MDEAASATMRADRLLGGRLIVHQPVVGHRAGTDAVLLAAAADFAGAETFIDVGAGVGTVGLAVASAHPASTGVLFEREPDLAELARRNVAANGFEGRVRVLCADLFDRDTLKAEGLIQSAGLILSNPPFYLNSETRSSPDALRARAHTVADERGHRAWLSACAGLAAPKGRMLFIHRAEALGDLLNLPAGWGAPIVKSIHPRLVEPASRILFGATQARRTPLCLLPPLILHDAAAFTSEAEALHQGSPLPFWPKKNRPRKEAG